MIESNLLSIEDISKNRLKVCYKCPLYSVLYGGLCNKKMYLNKETGDISTKAMPGYTKGCGCLVVEKSKNKAASCPLEKW